MATKRLLIAAGGTGGHMFPAQALAEFMIVQSWDVAMMTDPRGHRHTGKIPAKPILEIPSATISPRYPVKAAQGLFILQRGTSRAKTFMRDWRPDVVVGFGGYPAFPAMRAAQSLRLPTLLHEQNAVLGRVNRVFARRANAVASGFDVLQRLPRGATHVVTGNPLRQQIIDAIPDSYTAPDSDNSGDIHLLVVGGSLGARTIAQTVPRAVAKLPPALRRRLVVTQQTTESELDRARLIYTDCGVRHDLATFFADIQTHLARAHLVIGRAGASSVSEFAAMGLPSILVPLAIAMDDHQTVNASALARRNAAVVMPESTFTADALAKVLEDKLDDTHWLESAARAAKDAARPDATHALAQLVVTAAG